MPHTTEKPTPKEAHLLKGALQKADSRKETISQEKADVANQAEQMGVLLDALAKELNAFFQENGLHERLSAKCSSVPYSEYPEEFSDIKGITQNGRKQESRMSVMSLNVVDSRLGKIYKKIALVYCNTPHMTDEMFEQYRESFLRYLSTDRFTSTQVIADITSELQK